MASTASISFPVMTTLMEKMPSYSCYRTEQEAAEAERIYRQALGAMLQGLRRATC